MFSRSYGFIRRVGTARDLSWVGIWGKGGGNPKIPKRAKPCEVPNTEIPPNRLRLKGLGGLGFVVRGSRGSRVWEFRVSSFTSVWLPELARSCWARPAASAFAAAFRQKRRLLRTLVWVVEVKV